jgi:hypothetical protein
VGQPELEQLVLQQQGQLQVQLGQQVLQQPLGQLVLSPQERKPQVQL